MNIINFIYNFECLDHLFVNTGIVHMYTHKLQVHRYTKTSGGCWHLYVPERSI